MATYGGRGRRKRNCRGAFYDLDDVCARYMGTTLLQNYSAAFQRPWEEKGRVVCSNQQPITHIKRKAVDATASTFAFAGQMLDK